MANSGHQGSLFVIVQPAMVWAAKVYSMYKRGGQQRYNWKTNSILDEVNVFLLSLLLMLLCLLWFLLVCFFVCLRLFLFLACCMLFVVLFVVVIIIVVLVVVVFCISDSAGWGKTCMWIAGCSLVVNIWKVITEESASWHVHRLILYRCSMPKGSIWDGPYSARKHLTVPRDWIVRPWIHLSVLKPKHVHLTMFKKYVN